MTTAEKDLGVLVDCNLNFDQHIFEIVKKANRLVGMISRVITFKDERVMVPLFKALVRSVLEYGNAVWCPYLVKHLEAIENVQRKFTKRIIGVTDLDYEARLIRLKLPSLEFRRLRGDMIEVYKMTHASYDCKITAPLFTIKESDRTRGHSLQLTKFHSKSTRFSNFFTNRIVNYWNKLPNSIVNSGTTNAFKNALDIYWKDFKYKVNLKDLLPS